MVQYYAIVYKGRILLSPQIIGDVAEATGEIAAVLVIRCINCKLSCPFVLFYLE